jgi:DNA-binding NarL/FixJ family response regulator
MNGENKGLGSDLRRGFSCRMREEVKRSAKILLADDFELWRRFVISLLQKKLEWQVICEVSDGMQVVQRVRELRPDLVLLDISLPTLNGIEAARLIRASAPDSKVLFVSVYDTLDIAEAALRAGGQGYVIKSRSAGDLLIAVEAILEGRQFVSSTLKRDALTHASGSQFVEGAHYIEAPL